LLDSFTAVQLARASLPSGGAGGDSMPSPEKSVPAGFHQWPEARQNDWLRTQLRRMGESRGRKFKIKPSGSLRKAIAELSTRHPTQTSVRWFATQLIKRPEYKNIPDRTPARGHCRSIGLGYLDGGPGRRVIAGF
jgi:hypothetical protein